VTYEHAEAFCLMKYRSDDGTDEEIVWNGRDGVTPFFLTLRSGKTAKHVDWHLDQRMPEDYKPLPGMRMFVDLTPERALEAARANLERWKAEGLPMDNAPTAEELAKGYMKQPGSPDIVTVS
jgi:hypothetical protein